MPYVTGAAILTHVGIVAPDSPPTAADTAWAGTCADALEALIAQRMAGVTITAGITDELERAALQDGAAAYKDRDAPHGVLTTGNDGEAVRLGADIGRTLRPVFARYAGPGIG
jgi:hypothetical protein